MHVEGRTISEDGFTASTDRRGSNLLSMLMRARFHLDFVCTDVRVSRACDVVPARRVGRRRQLSSSAANFLVFRRVFSRVCFFARFDSVLSFWNDKYVCSCLFLSPSTGWFSCCTLLFRESSAGFPPRRFPAFRSAFSRCFSLLSFVSLVHVSPTIVRVFRFIRFTHLSPSLSTTSLVHHPPCQLLSSLWVCLWVCPFYSST